MNFQCLRLFNLLDSRIGEVGKRGALGGLFNLIVTDFVIQTRPADLEKFCGLGAVTSGLLECLKNPRTFRLACGSTRNGTEIVPCRPRFHRRNVFAAELETGGGDDRPFEIVLQLTDIARPCGLG